MEVLNNQVVAVLGILASIVTIVSVFLPAQNRKTKILHLVYGLAIVALAVPLTSYATQLSRIRRVERAANVLVQERYDQFPSDAGFVQATLAFLEANRQIFPDAYTRAQKMCEAYGCYKGGQPDVDKMYSMSDLASAMSGLLRGIAAVESSR